MKIAVIAFSKPLFCRLKQRQMIQRLQWQKHKTKKHGRQYHDQIKKTYERPDKSTKYCIENFKIDQHNTDRNTREIKSAKYVFMSYRTIQLLTRPSVQYICIIIRRTTFLVLSKFFKKKWKILILVFIPWPWYILQR